MIPLRDENPSTSTPFVTGFIILVCVVVFLYMFLLPEAQVARFIASFGTVPAAVTGQGGEGGLRAYGTLVTSMFLHGGWWHLIGNMLYLWIFGDNVEDLMGHGGFLIFYLITGIAAAASHIALNATSTLPMVGASGAISGVLGGYLVLFPRARIISIIPLFYFFRIVAVPAIVFLPLWFLIQFSSGLLSLGVGGSGVAFWAHVGGFAAGVVLVRVFTRRRRGRVSWQ
jgi:membrane associated rhomboid family serine protease